MKKWEIAVLAGFVLAVLITNFVSFAETCGEVRGDTLRLHILANSDSEKDQAEKLAVRDAVLAEFGPMLAEAQGREEAEALVRENGREIAEFVNGTLEARGSSHTARVRLVTMYFGVGEYDGFTLPAGEYDAVRIEIGDAAGHNWFCVMYPALCLPAASGGEDDALDGYTDEEKAVVTSPYKIKFAALEWIESLTARQTKS